MFNSWIPTPVPSINKGCSSLLFFGFSSSRAKDMFSSDIYVLKWHKDRMASRLHQEMFWRVALKSEMIFPFLLRIIIVEIKRTRGASRYEPCVGWIPMCPRLYCSINFSFSSHRRLATAALCKVRFGHQLYIFCIIPWQYIWIWHLYFIWKTASWNPVI